MSVFLVTLKEYLERELWFQIRSKQHQPAIIMTPAFHAKQTREIQITCRCCCLLKKFLDLSCWTLLGKQGLGLPNNKPDKVLRERAQYQMQGGAHTYIAHACRLLPTSNAQPSGRIHDENKVIRSCSVSETGWIVYVHNGQVITWSKKMQIRACKNAVDVGKEMLGMHSKSKEPRIH